MSNDPSIDGLARSVGFDLPDRYNASRLLWDNLEDRSARPAVISDRATLSYWDLAGEASQIGNALLGAGLAPGDRVLLFMDDEPAYPAAIIGALRAGLVPMLINTLSNTDLLRFYLEDSGAMAVIVSEPHASLFGPEVLSGTACGSMMIANSEPPWRTESSDLDEAPTQREDMAFWMYSSGSTGRPKGVVHRHEDAAYTAITYANSVLKLTPDDVCFSVPKIFFAYGFGNSVTFPFAAGAASVLMAGRPDPPAVFEQIKRHRPTVFFGLPTLYTALARHPSSESADLSSVRSCISAAEILSADIADAWRARFGHHIVEGLGSTEVLHIYLSNTSEWRKTGSAGVAVPGYAIRLMGSDDGPVAEDEEGIMEVLGLSSARQYWNRPDKTEETMRDGWIRTGDRFVRDEDGFYFFKGRADDLVKVSGQWVYPLEIEIAINEHEAVHESCVLAVQLPDERMTIRAWVVLKSGVAKNDTVVRSIQDHAKTSLLPHKYPRDVIFVAELPKTGTGKIDRQRMQTNG